MGMRQVVELGWAPRPLREDVETLVTATWRSARAGAGLSWEDASERFRGMVSVLEFVGARELAEDLWVLADLAAALEVEQSLQELRSGKRHWQLETRWAA